MILAASAALARGAAAQPENPVYVDDSPRAWELFQLAREQAADNQGESVRLEITSEDVSHGIGIEDYDIDRQLEPGKTEVVTFTADKTGQHHFHCSVYCGAGHNDMHGTLVVLPESQ